MIDRTKQTNEMDSMTLSSRHFSATTGSLQDLQMHATNGINEIKNQIVKPISK